MKTINKYGRVQHIHKSTSTGCRKQNFQTLSHEQNRCVLKEWIQKLNLTIEFTQEEFFTSRYQSNSIQFNSKLKLFAFSIHSNVLLN